jgi:hypothetical protein
MSRSATASKAGEIQEVGDILAAGFLRLFEKKSSQNFPSGAKTPLDCETPSEGHVPKKIEDMAP